MEVMDYDTMDIWFISFLIGFRLHWVLVIVVSVSSAIRLDPGQVGEVSNGFI